MCGGVHALHVYVGVHALRVYVGVRSLRVCVWVLCFAFITLFLRHDPSPRMQGFQTWMTMLGL